MGFIEDYRKIYENIQKAHPEMSRPERKALMARILNEHRMPTRFSEERMLDIVNHMLYKAGKKLLNTSRVMDYYEQPDHAYEHGFINLPDADQREARRKKSKAVRLAMIDIAEEEAITLKEVARTTHRDTSSLPTDVTHLFRLAALDASPAEQKRIQEYNAEVADLFGNEVSRQARRDKLVREHNLSQTDAEAYLRRRRAQIVMDQVRSVMSDLDDLDSLQASLLDPALPANQLAENAKKIEHLRMMAIELDRLLSRIPKDFILTEEDMQLAEKVRRQQNACVKASEQVHAMASSVYEYLDADMLQGLNDFSFYDSAANGWEMLEDAPWEKNIAEDAAELDVFVPEQQEPELDAESARYLEGTTQNADDMFFDELNIKGDKRDHSRRVELENVLQSYGFSSVVGHNRHHSEKFNEDSFTLETGNDTVDALSDAPFAMEWHGRCGVFQHTADGFQAVAPETLVNYGMHEKHGKLRSMIDAVSVPNGPGREQFIRLKGKLNTLTPDDFVAAPGAGNRGKLGTKDEDGYFKSLEQDATDYLISVDEMLARVETMMRRPRGYKPTSREQRTLDRARVARAIRDFAQTKQKELELLGKARSTMAEFDRLSPEQRLTRIAEMDEEREIEERKAHTGQWLKNKIRDTYIGDNARRNDIPESISQPLSNEIDRLDPQKLEEMIQKDPDRFDALLGRMVAAELIMLEDSNIQRAPNIYNPKGILRAKYENADDSTFRSLGWGVRDTLDTRPGILGKPTREEIYSTLKKFDPKKCAAKMLDGCYRDEEKSPVKARLEGRFVAPVHQARGNEPDKYERAVEKFAKENILEFEVNDLRNPRALIVRDRGFKLLADCVIISLILKEREMRGMAPDHGTLESMLLRDPSSVDALRDRIMKADWFIQTSAMLDYRGAGSITAANMTNYLDMNVPQQIADTVFRAVVDERNDQLYAGTLHELQAHGLQNPTFRKMNGEALDPAKRTDLEYIVSGRTLYATEGNTEVLFHADANLYNTDPGKTVFHAVNTAAIKQLQGELARIPGATMTKAVGNPFSSVATPDKVLDLNTTEGMQYVVDGKPFIVSDGTNLTSYKYDSEKRSFNTYPRPPYEAIAAALEANGFSRNLNEIAFNKPDGTDITAEQMNDPTSRNLQYMVSGRPFYVTANGGHQVKLSYREDGNRRYFEAESTAHNSLMEFLSGNSTYNLLDALQQIYDLSQTGVSIAIAKSEQYDALVDSVAAFNEHHKLFMREQFLDPLISGYLHEMADKIAQAADTFLNGEGHKYAQRPRRKVAEYAKQAALELNQYLERETHERLAGKAMQDYSEIRDENLAVYTVPKNMVHGQPEHDYAGAANHREELVTWLRDYQNYMNTLGNEVANGANDELDPAAVAKKLNFDPDKYTAEDLTSAGIDGSVLTVDENRENFLKNEDNRLKNISTDRGFTFTSQSDRREMVINWLKDRQNALKKEHSGQASVREEFVKWIYDTLPDFAKSLTDKNVGDSKVADRTNNFLKALDIDHHVLDAYGYREYFIWKLDQPQPEAVQAQQPEVKDEVKDIGPVQVEWLFNPINPDDYADAHQRAVMQEFSKRWTSNAQREEFLNRYFPGFWKEKMTDEGIAYRDFKQSNNLSSLLNQLDKSPMPRVGLTQLKLFVDQYASVLNSMNSLSKANILALRAALDVLRVETNKLSKQYKDNDNVAAKVKDEVCPLLDQLENLERSQIVRLNDFDRDLHTVEDLNPEQQAIANRKYSILKDRFETQLIPAMERADASDLSFIDKVKLSKAVDNLRDCFDEAESLTPKNCTKLLKASLALHTQISEIGEEHEALADLVAFNDMVDDVASETDRVLDVAGAPDKEPQDEKMPFSNFRKNRLLRMDEVLDDLLVDKYGKHIDKDQLTPVGQADYNAARDIRSLLQKEPNEDTLDRLRNAAENFVNRIPGYGEMAAMTSKMLAFCNELLDMLPSVAPPAGVKMAPAEEKQPVEPANKVVIDANLGRAKELADSLNDKNVPMQYQTLGTAMQHIVADMENPLALNEFFDLKTRVEETLRTLDDFIVAGDGASEPRKAITAANKQYLDNYGLKWYLDTLSSEIGKAEAVRNFKDLFKGRYKLVVDGLRRAEGAQVVGNHEAIGVQLASIMVLIDESLDALSDAESVGTLRNNMEVVRSTYESLKTNSNFEAPELEVFFNDMSEELNGLDVPANQVVQPVVAEEEHAAEEDLEKDLDNGNDYQRENRLSDYEPVEEPQEAKVNAEEPDVVKYADFAARYATRAEELRDQLRNGNAENSMQYQMSNMLDVAVKNLRTENPTEQTLAVVSENYKSLQMLLGIQKSLNIATPEFERFMDDFPRAFMRVTLPQAEAQQNIAEPKPEENVINEQPVEQPVVNQPVQQARPNNEGPNPAQQAVQILRELKTVYDGIINTAGMEDIKHRMDENIPERFESSKQVFTEARNAFAAHIQDMQNPPTLLDMIHVQVQTHADKMNYHGENVVIDNNNAIIELMQRQELSRPDDAKISKNLRTIIAYSKGQHKNRNRIDAANAAWRRIDRLRTSMARARNRINEVQALLERNGIAGRMDELYQLAMDLNVKLEDIQYEAPAAQANVNEVPEVPENGVPPVQENVNEVPPVQENANAAGPDVEQNVEVQQNIAEPKSLDALKTEAEAIVEKVQKSQDLKDNVKSLIVGPMQVVIEEIGVDVKKVAVNADIAKRFADNIIGVQNAVPEIMTFFDELTAAIKAQEPANVEAPKEPAKAEEPKQEVQAEKAEEPKPEDQAENIDNNVINDLNEQKVEAPQDGEKPEEPKPEDQAENNGNNVINDLSEKKDDAPKEDEKVEEQKPEEQKPEDQAENNGNNVINDLSEKKDDAPKEDEKVEEQKPEDQAEKAEEPKQEVENVNNNVINDLNEQKDEEPQAVPFADFRNKMLPQARELEEAMLKLTRKELKQYAPGMLDNIREIRTALESTNLTIPLIFEMWNKVNAQSMAMANIRKKTIDGLMEFYTDFMGAASDAVMHPQIPENKKSDAAEPVKTVPTIPNKQEKIQPIDVKQRKVPPIPEKQPVNLPIHENKIVDNQDDVQELKEPYADLRSKFLLRAEKLKTEMDKQTQRQTQRFMTHYYTPDTIKNFTDGVLADLKSGNLTEDKLKEMRQHAQDQAAKIAEGESSRDNPSHGFPGLEDFLEELTKGIDVALSPEMDLDEGPGPERRKFEAKFQKKLNGDGTLSLDELKEYYKKQAAEQADTLFNAHVTKSIYHSEDTVGLARLDKLTKLANKLGQDMNDATTLDEAIKALKSFVGNSQQVSGVSYTLPQEPLSFIAATGEAIPKMEKAVLGKSVMSPEDTRNFRQAVQNCLSVMQGVKQMVTAKPDEMSLGAREMVRYLDKLTELLEPMEYPSAANIDAWRKEIARSNLVLPMLTMEDTAIYRQLIGSQIKYLDEKADMWSFIPKKLKASNAAKNASFDGNKDAREFYKAADSLLELEFMKNNSITREIDARLAELLAKNTKTRAYEICIQKKDERSNKKLQNSKTMRDLALYATMKAALLNEQLNLGENGYLTRLTEKLSENQMAAKNKEKEKFSAEALKNLINETDEFQDKFKHLTNAGMYDFIVKRGYKDLAADVNMVLYDKVNALRENGRNTLQKGGTKQNNASMQKNDDKKIRAK